MRVQLLNPPVFHYTGMPPYRMNPNLGLPIIASVLNNAGHTCEVADLEALGVTPGQLTTTLREQRSKWPDVIGLTALTASARGCRDSIQAIREAGFDRPIVVGGVHATLFPREPLEWGADMVITGECEGNVEGLLRLVHDRMHPLAQYVPYTWKPGVFAGKPLPIDQISTPDWEHHSPHPHRYAGNYPKVGHPEAITMWSRGCPWHCVFCGNTIFGGQPTRYRPPEAVEQELRGLKEMGTRALFVYDDELVGGPMPDGWMADVAGRIAPLGLAWKAQGRCSKKHITPALLADMKRAGCKVIMWGVESFSPNVLRATKKGTLPSDIWHTLRTAKEAGIANWLFTMVGNLEETEDDLALTAECLRTAYLEGLVDYRQTTVVTALPGTELWDIQQRDGWWTAPPETGAQMHQVYSSTPWLTGEQIAHWMRQFDAACPVGAMGRAA